MRRSAMWEGFFLVEMRADEKVGGRMFGMNLVGILNRSS